MFKHIKRFLWLLLAIISFIFGVIGILLPVVPQVPFFILGFFSLSKFSLRFHNWMVNTKIYRKLQKFLDEKIAEAEARSEHIKQTWYQVLWLKFLLLAKN
ncbi:MULTISPECIES: DUF454 family protein [Ligilactobacillus]|uniref:DUF454 domain-containing protein n=1 Tax=Ligilactobacillus animalis TaxID=1605 RepID=A0ABR4RQF3_9LACO|nr:DUF454 family protein [Ligilactobacillus animalis]KDA46289.1 hypothetical protein Lani381_0700 [Ligilactobacillus animalis]MDQ2234556.1 YbaN family protein [Ligilactobacillus animalis]MDU3187867.1 DUF454 family protein [Ligilactobacillus animalis]MEE0261390.1 DUF454 family protein [Ligilactobacillus animalis]OCX49401.1 DUF454 domain-containing protein [Ligilactobacillus animalis]